MKIRLNTMMMLLLVLSLNFVLLGAAKAEVLTAISQIKEKPDVLSAFNNPAFSILPDTNQSFASIFGNAAASAAATTYTVDTTADDAALTACTDAANDCSLRGAIINANAAAGADTINIDAAVFSTAQTITFSSTSPIQQLIINSDLTINGPGASLLTVKGYVNYGGIPIFEISGGAVAINNLKLTGGRGRSCVDYSTGAAFNTTCGGAIYMTGGTATSAAARFPVITPETAAPFTRAATR